MKLRWWYGIVLNLMLAALVISGTAAYVVHRRGGGPILEIRDTDSGRVYGRWPLKETEEFAIEFIHSVNQSPVREIFRAEGKEILPQALRFYSFGAGMPTDLEEGQTMIQEGDTLVITGFNTSFRELNCIVGTVSDHLLFVSGETVSLRDLCGKNAHITLRIR